MDANSVYTFHVSRFPVSVSRFTFHVSRFTFYAMFSAFSAVHLSSYDGKFPGDVSSSRVGDDVKVHARSHHIPVRIPAVPRYGACSAIGRENVHQLAGKREDPDDRSVAGKIGEGDLGVPAG